MQVAPRPVLTNVALQVPVLAADASSAQLEADLLKGNLQLTHTRLQLADLVSPSLHTDRNTCPLAHNKPHVVRQAVYRIQPVHVHLSASTYLALSTLFS